MIWLVLFFCCFCGVSIPSCMRNGLISVSVAPIANVDEVSFDGRRRCHAWTHQMRAPTTPLSSFEITIASRRATFAFIQNVGIHSQAHRASRLSPLRSSPQEALVQ